MAVRVPFLGVIRLGNFEDRETARRFLLALIGEREAGRIVGVQSELSFGVGQEEARAHARDTRLRYERNSDEGEES